jgi:hypothetical protein
VQDKKIKICASSNKWGTVLAALVRRMKPERDALSLYEPRKIGTKCHSEPVLTSVSATNGTRGKHGIISYS